jgi:hypothetical protein
LKSYQLVLFLLFLCWFTSFAGVYPTVAEGEQVS